MTIGKLTFRNCLNRSFFLYFFKFWELDSKFMKFPSTAVTIDIIQKFTFFTIQANISTIINTIFPRMQQITHIMSQLKLSGNFKAKIEKKQNYALFALNHQKSVGNRHNQNFFLKMKRYDQLDAFRYPKGVTSTHTDNFMESRTLTVIFAKIFKIFS